MPDWEQADRSLEWEHFLTFLKHTVDAAYKTNQMTSDQQVKDYELVRQLKYCMPITERLGVAKPKVSAKA